MMFTDAKEVRINNKLVKSIKSVDDNMTLYINARLMSYATILTINVPLNLVYSDDFQISGTLTDINNTPLENQTVKLYVGSTSVATGTTDSEGVVSFTQTPVTTGTHSFQLVYEGDGTFNPAYSSTVTREIGKETTVIFDSSPSHEYYNDITQISLFGRITDDEGNNISSNGTVQISENGNILKTKNLNNSKYSILLTDTLFENYVGTHDLTVTFIGDDNYATSSIDVQIIIKEAYLTVTSDKDVLSYVDNDSCTLTAVYHAGNWSGKSVSFEVRKVSDDSLVETLTGVTDSNGECSVGYVGKGAGDLNIKVDCMNLQETYSIEDCVDTILGETDQSNKFGSSIALRNNGTSNISYDSTNKYYSVNITKTNSESFIPINSANGLDDVVIEFDGYLPITNSFLGLCFYKENSNWGRLGAKWESNDSKFEYGGNTNGSYVEYNISGYAPPTTTWLHYKFTITNDTVHRQVYNGSTLIYEDTRTYTGFFTSNTKYGFTALWSTHWKQYFKNIKIKPL